jgi:hypothetical protein
MTKIIYVVTEGEYSDYGIEALFSERETAEKYAKRRNGNDKYSTARVEEYPLDAAREARSDGLAQYAVVMGKDGNNARASESLDAGYLCVITHYLGGEHLHLTVDARDKAHAIKIANEKRGQIIATEQWDSLKE